MPIILSQGEQIEFVIIEISFLINSNSDYEFQEAKIGAHIEKSDSRWQIWC